MSNDDQPTTMQDLRDLVRTCVEDEAEYLRERQYPEDGLHEIVDSCVPTYYHELAEVLADCPDLGLHDPREYGFDPASDNAYSLIQRAIYEQLYRVADEEWRKIEGEA